ncbi:hypothetical protein RBH26_13800 [Natronolimnohabitans sp. A-GB9]|uniref:hypothetical protein n=1 Tax=Natronolimnohabitans sp. A-GB9 TaxID=3069757 RepID=UPI0027B60595|nr:hypothetical protein [Natronolimnohabitans sp. A-GB9]MDQ2051551.1 hypothetical protein [Natronolimnohabitans sp. A-GB9]
MDEDRHPDRVPGRQTRPAYSTTRRTWYGYGHLTRAEKSGFGRYLHDCSYVFGDVSVFSLPVLFAIVVAPGAGAFDATAAGLLAWATMVAVGAAIRGGWITPLATETLGWVSVTPVLLGFRLIYYNCALGLAVFGGVALADAVGYAPLSLLVAITVTALATLAFPRLAQSFYGALRDV